jgi:hypothetical protein
MKPFSEKLNSFIVDWFENNRDKFSTYEKSQFNFDDVEQTYKDFKDHYDKLGTVPMWFDTNEDNIFGDIEVNAKFRAWHDYYHVLLSKGFSLSDEKEVYEEQQKLLPKDWDFERRLLYCEIVKQAEFYTENKKKKIKNQRKFTKEFLKKDKNMKKNFEAVYVLDGTEYRIKTPVSLAMLLKLQEDITLDDELYISESVDNALEESYSYLSESVVDLFVKATELVGDFTADFLLPTEKDEYGFRVIISRLEQPTYSSDEEDDIVGRKEIIISKNNRGNNIIHFKSLTEDVGKEPGIRHYLSNDEKVKNSIIGLTDDSIIHLYSVLENYILNKN